MHDERSNRMTNNFGGKAAGLNLLGKYGVPVPHWTAITYDMAQNLSDSVLDDILSHFDSNDKVAVRSSAANEDGTKKSFAGMFETKLNVSVNKKDLKSAISAVVHSASANRVIDYDNATNQMGIVIQKMIKPNLSGVAFTNALDTDGKTVVLIEVVSGLGEKLVSGLTTPTQIKIPLINGKIDEKNVSVSGVLLNGIEQINKLIHQIQKIIDTSHNKPLDLEWCIDDQGGVWFVQARPITVPVLIKNKSVTSAIPVVGGIVTAPVYIIPEVGAWTDTETMEKYFSNFPDGAILVAKYTEVNFVSIMKRASGIITEQGGMLSHAAIISRELGIPCIVNYAGILDKFKNGDVITMNATNGTITGCGDIVVNENIWRDEAWLFDNMQRIAYKSGCVFVEQCFDHVNVYAPWISRADVSDLEIFIRKRFGITPNIIIAGNQNEMKFYSWFDNRNHKKLPEYTRSLDKATKIAKSYSAAKVHNFYKHCIDVAKKYAVLAKNATNDATRLYYSETVMGQYILLDVIFPRAIVMNQLYADTVYKLYLADAKFSDLWAGKKIKGIQKRYIDFIKAISDERDSVFTKFKEIYPEISDYWKQDNYETMFKKALQAIGITKPESNWIGMFFDNLSKVKKYL